MSETDIVWHWHWVNSEVLEFKNFLFSFLFWDLILFELSFFLMLFISWYYVTLSLTRFWHYMTLTLSRSWDCLTLRLSDTDIEWLLKLLSSENFLFSFFFFLWFSLSFHSFWDFNFFDIIYFLILPESDFNYILTLSDSDINQILTLYDSDIN